LKPGAFKLWVDLYNPILMHCLTKSRAFALIPSHSAQLNPKSLSDSSLFSGLVVFPSSAHAFFLKSCGLIPVRSGASCIRKQRLETRRFHATGQVEAHFETVFFHCIGSRVETRRLSSYRSKLDSACTAPTGEEDVRDDTEGPDVGGGAVAFRACFFYDLGRHVHGCAAHCARRSRCVRNHRRRRRRRRRRATLF
jgi:hypothetical protein